MPSSSTGSRSGRDRWCTQETPAGGNAITGDFWPTWAAARPTLRPAGHYTASLPATLARALSDSPEH